MLLLIFLISLFLLQFLALASLHHHTERQRGYVSPLVWLYPYSIS